MTKGFTYGALTIAAVLVGCGGNGGNPGNDAGTPESDSGAPMCGDPGAPYGTSEGSHFLPFTLNRCDGTPYEFYGETEGYCEAQLTVLSIAAGWCNPCRMEAPLLRQIEEDYRAQGVRVVSVIIQNNSFGEPTGTFCQGWVDEYSFVHPTLIDPAQETQIYFPMGALPATLVVDSTGTIRHREYGVSANLASLRGTLDTLLAE